MTSSIAILFFIAIGICYAERAPFSSFAKDATLAEAIEYYDYIVVGGGTAGCSLAATLSASAKVLLLERGGLPYNNPQVTHITGFRFSLTDVSPTSAAQLFISTDGVFNHRARVLGGGSAINAGFYTRASPSYVRNQRWDPHLVNTSYEWVENKVAFGPVVGPWQAAIRDGLLEAGVSPYRGITYDHVPGTKIGGSIFDENGYRHTAADLLEYANPLTITVYLYATVHRILIRGESAKAYGVLYRDSRGRGHVAYSTSEVIVSAGAIGSPQILMLSGIGPANELMAHGIGVIVDNPMVGRGMSDNPMNGIIIPSTTPLEISLIQAVGITSVGSYIEAASGHFDLAMATTMLTDYARITNQTIPPSNNLTALYQLYDNPNAQVGIILEKIMGPVSQGHLHLQTRNPNDNPTVTFNYFEDPIDLQRCVQGMEVIQRVVESTSLSRFRYPFTSFQTYLNLVATIPNNLRTRTPTTSYTLDQFCRDTVMTIWHYHGGCQVDRVVDRHYRVIGVDALRVIDGSTFYDSPGTNPQATVMMLGRYMGQKILQQRFDQVGSN